MSIFKRIFTGSLTWNAVLVLCAVAAIAFGGVFAFVGGGFLMKTASFFGGVVAVLLGLRLVTLIRGLQTPDDPGLDLICTDAVALAILRSAYVIGICLLAGAAYGESLPPSPAAWPDERPAAGMVRDAPDLRASAEPRILAELWPSRYADCEPWRAEIERAVSLYWGAFQYPAAWAAQLYQESLCDPWAVSPAGAAGLAQFMPATWREARTRLGLDVALTPHDDIAIEAGAWYQARMMAVWRSPRPPIERWRLGLASYNAGAGNIIAAQRACDGARDWRVIETCLPSITGRHAAETRTYVVRIERWWGELAGGDPLAGMAGGVG